MKQVIQHLSTSTDVLPSIEASKRPTNTGFSYNTYSTGSLRDEKPFQIDLEPEAEATEECPICWDDVLPSEIVNLSCGHSMCGLCISSNVKHALSTKQFPLYCPVCRHGNSNKSLWTKVDISEIKDVLSLKEARELEDGCLKAEFINIYCPYSDCGSGFYFEVEDDGFTLVQCPSCSRGFCGSCKVPWSIHCRDGVSLSCQEFLNLPDEERSEEDRLFFAFIREQNFKRCPRCGIVIEKNNGCNHMVCIKCNCNFCYVDGEEVDPENLTQHYSANHPLFQFEDVVHD